MKIYTKFGDQGQTRLIGSGSLDKSNPVFEVIGELDELNSQLGLSLAGLFQSPDSQKPIEVSSVEQALVRVQHELFEWGSLLAGADSSKFTIPGDAAISRLEVEIDGWQDQLPPMTHFILPGGCNAGATLHVARSVCAAR